MTNDLISRKALVKALIAERDKHPPELTERYSFGAKVPCKFNQAIRGGIRKALREIEMAPAVDAAPVVHGRWINQDSTYTKYQCSACKVMNFDGVGRYCPNCGARMRREE